MSDIATADLDDQFDEEFHTTLGPYFEGERGRQRIEELTRKARYAMHSVKRIGLNEVDAVYSAIRTALRREGEPAEAPAPEEDLWGWFERLFWKKCKQYRDRQRTLKHGWTSETDHFTQEESGSVAVADPRRNAPLDADDIEAHIRHVLSIIDSEHLSDSDRALAGLLAKGHTPKEIGEMSGKSADSIRRAIRRLRRKIDPDYRGDE